MELEKIFYCVSFIRTIVFERVVIKEIIILIFQN